jgi:type II secretory pathway pseudopilin PulG
MRTLLRKPSADPRQRRWRACATGAALTRRLRAADDPGAENGFLLIEVVISALIVGLIVVGLLSGLSVASNTSADQRRHDQAAVLAAESQEQLRTDPASTLEVLEVTPHSYTKTLSSTKYTVTESTKYINNETQASACTSPSEASKQNGNYIQITSVVSWTAANSTYPKVEQSSIVTPPTGSALEISAVNGAKPEQGVAGVTATAEYTGVESTRATTVEGTTGANGCIVFGAIPATAATVNVNPPLGYVTPSDSINIPTEAVTLAPNLTTHKEYTVNRGGAIKAEFTYEGKTEYLSKPVKGETFVAFNSKLATPQYVLGSTSYTYETGEEERYTPLAGVQATTATTPIDTGYPTGNVFPWSEKYVVYAGDCLKDSVTETSNPLGLKNEEVLVEPGATANVKVPLSRVSLSVYTGSKTSPNPLTAEKLPVRVTSTGCEKSTANDATAPLYIHTQTLSGAGHLENPLQPFGTYNLCVYYKKGTTGYNYNVTYTNETTAGSSPNIYLGTPEKVGEQTVETNPSSPC